MKTGIELIAEERRRQIEVENWAPNRDVRHVDESLAYVAACYTIPSNGRNIYAGSNGLSNIINVLWPKSWAFKFWKPSPENRIRELQKAGALIAAEIDRLQLPEYINNNTLNITEAMLAFSNGKKVGHIYFLKDEYIKLNSKNEMEDEKGTILNKADFWLSRISEKFENGWFIID